jgi:hypothetical protein
MNSNLKESQNQAPASKEFEAFSRLHAQRNEDASKLLQNIKAQLLELEELLHRIEGQWGIEDSFYRLYHQSFKVYHLQSTTEEICKALQQLLPDHSLNDWFSEIIAQGTGKEFELSHNKEWLVQTRPILEAFFHAHFFLKMAVKYGKELETAPNVLPSGWAAVLYLFNLR